MNLAEFHNLSAHQQIIFEEAYRKENLDPQQFICLGKVKMSDPFFKPFIEKKLILKDHLKFCGVFRLSKLGTEAIENIYKIKNELYERAS